MGSRHTIGEKHEDIVFSLNFRSLTFDFSISGVEQKRGRCLAGTGQTKLIRSQIALIDTTSLPITVSGTEGGGTHSMLFISLYL